MVAPGLLFLLVFSFIPMIGVIIAFQDYDIVKGFVASSWVGLKHFREIFSHDRFYLALRNSIGLSVFKFGFLFAAPILFAVLLNEMPFRGFKRITQTASYLPHFLSYVVVANIWIVLLNSKGVVNELLASAGFIDEPIAFLSDSRKFWPLAVVIDLWMETGWNAIIYLAAMSAINPELYEAAIVDGAGRVRRIVHITIPSIAWTISILFILNFGNLLKGGPVGSNFNQSYLLGNIFNRDASYVLEHYVLDMGLKLGRFSFSTAANLFQSLVSLALLLLANYAAKRLSGRNIF